jgi:hypothetical protein
MPERERLPLIDDICELNSWRLTQDTLSPC